LEIGDTAPYIYKEPAFQLEVFLAIPNSGESTQNPGEP
jgi:hypothetical protein